MDTRRGAAMDLMKGSTSFRSLRKKYDDFSAPSVEVTVGSTKLVSGAGADILIWNWS